MTNRAPAASSALSCSGLTFSTPMILTIPPVCSLRCRMLMGVMLPAGIVKDTRGVAQNPIATLQAGRRGFPAARQPRVEQLAIRRLVTPDGDRRHGPQSGRVIYQVPALEGNEHVVSVFVLGENTLDVDRRTLGTPPTEHALERGMCGNAGRQPCACRRVEARVVKQRDHTPITRRATPASVPPTSGPSTGIDA